MRSIAALSFAFALALGGEVVLVAAWPAAAECAPAKKKGAKKKKKEKAAEEKTEPEKGGEAEEKGAPGAEDADANGGASDEGTTSKRGSDSKKSDETKRGSKGDDGTGSKRASDAKKGDEASSDSGNSAASGGPEDEQKRVEEAKKKLAIEGRKGSQITPGSASRWSNRGAMTPIVSEVPITAELPERAKPVAAGTVETPGQALTGSEELLQARFSVSAYHLRTSGQDVVYFDPRTPLVNVTTRVLPGENRDIDIYRWRASMAYERIAGSEIGAHLDLEYRARTSGTRPTDHRINELYLSYGLTDFRGRTGGLDYGVAVGRVAVREAGYAVTDGGALRLRLSEDVNLGAFGGFTGNPYGYNWALHQTEEFSTQWINAGGFFSFRTPRIYADVAGVLTYARLSTIKDVAGAMAPGKTGIDRLYAYFDVAYLATESVDMFLLGWVDIVGSTPLQNLQAVIAYKATDKVDLRLGLGRYSTVIYDASTPYSFSVDDRGNQGTNAGSVIVDENGNPVVPYDAVLQTAIYNAATLRAGYRFVREAEVYVTGEAMLRDTSRTDQLTMGSPVVKSTVQFSNFRMMPGFGARYRNPSILDAGLELTYIYDKESQANAMIEGSLGRGYEGLYASLDLRHYFGTIAGTDGGLDLTYTLPRDWFPGRVLLRGMLHYYRENVALAQPKDPAAEIITTPDQLVIIPAQESYLGFLGLEWRL